MLTFPSADNMTALQKLRRNGRDIASILPSPPRGKGQGEGVEDVGVISWPFLSAICVTRCATSGDRNSRLREL